MIKYLFLLVFILPISKKPIVITEYNTITNAEALRPFFNRLDSLGTKATGTVSIAHIGDSHIQADFFTGTIRKKLQEAFGNAGRGFVFPYKIANSRGALDIKFTYTGPWEYCTILKNTKNCEIGASGYTVTANSPSATFLMDVASKGDSTSAFNKITILDNYGDFLPSINKSEYTFSQKNSHTVLTFNAPQDSLRFSANNYSNTNAILQGLILENGQKGILYHSLGINGSSTAQYLRSDDFSNQLSKINTDLIVISFGTNDSYLSRSSFCSACVKEKFRALIIRLRDKNPNIPIILTTPPDHYISRRYSNANIEVLISALYELVEEENIALWDLHRIMGGKNSIVKWRDQSLANKDLVHFTENGYRKQGELFYEALMFHYNLKK